LPFIYVQDNHSGSQHGVDCITRCARHRGRSCALSLVRYSM
jgi:hypothetical protein